MSEPIIIETTTTTRERLVLVPLLAVTVTPGGDDCLTVRSAAARDATPADMERGGWVTRDRYDNAQERVDQFAAEIGALTARAEKAERERDDLLEGDMREARTQRERADTAETERDTLRAELAEATALRADDAVVRDVLEAVEDESTYDAALRVSAEVKTLRAELERLTAPGEDRATDEELLALFNSTVEANSKTMAFPVRSAVAAVAARVRQERCARHALGGPDAQALEGALAQAERELRAMSVRAGDAERERDEAKELARVLEVERDEAAARADEAESLRDRVQRDATDLRAEVERLTAPGEGSEGEPTDEELLAIVNAVYDERGVSDDEVRPLIASRVAAHVRKERCLVAQAVGMRAGVTISRTSERVPGTTGMWDVYATRRPDVPGEHYAYGVPAADVPATLARLLGEVSKC